MPKMFRPSTREARILSEIESSREHARRKAIFKVKESIDSVSNALATKLIQSELVETSNKNAIEEQLHKCIETLAKADDFDIDYQIAPVRRLVENPNIVSLYITSFILEKLIKHKDVEDIYGSDEEIYECIDNQIKKYLKTAKKKINL